VLAIVGKVVSRVPPDCFCSSIDKIVQIPPFTDSLETQSWRALSPKHCKFRHFHSAARRAADLPRAHFALLLHHGQEDNRSQ
jgi:hypothetical protein